MQIDPQRQVADDLRKRLSKETHAVHEALHSHPRLLPLADGSINRQQLIAILNDYLAMYSALEDRRATMSWCASVSLSAPVASLEADIAELSGLPAVKRRFTKLPESEAHCLGALYVMLGAQFGARALGVNLSRAIPGIRSTYFAPCPKTLEAWRNLLSLLKDGRHGSDEEVATIAGAHRMFDELGRFLSSGSSARRPISIAAVDTLDGMGTGLQGGPSAPSNTNISAS